MFTPSQLTALISPVIIFFIFFLTRRRFRKTSLTPPGPPGLPFIGNLHQFNSASARHIHLWKLSQKYGPLMSMKLGTVPVLVVSSARTAKDVLKTLDHVFCSRPSLLGLRKLSYNFLDGGFAPYGESWKEMRKISVVHLLSSKQVQSFRPDREDEVYRMINGLSKLAKDGQPVNLSKIVMLLASTIINRVAFSKRYGEKNPARWRFDELMVESQAMQAGFFVSDYFPLFGWMDRISGMISRLDKTFKDLDEFYQELIDEHVDPNRPPPVNPDILDLLIHLKKEGSCAIDLTWDHIKALLMNILVAGTDTSAVSIIWTMATLIKNPNAMKKLQKEIRDTIGAKGRVGEDDIPHLKYLKVVIKECMRLYPPTPLLLPRETLQECTIDGYKIPPKTLVHVNAYAIARDPEYWENPHEFIPERFLDKSVDILGQNFEVIPFGSGRRGCPGISMGLATVELVVANLVYSFDWEMPCGMKKEDIDSEVLPGLVMLKKNPLILVPKIYNFCA